MNSVTENQINNNASKEISDYFYLDSRRYNSDVKEEE